MKWKNKESMFSLHSFVDILYSRKSFFLMMTFPRLVRRDDVLQHKQTNKQEAVNIFLIKKEYKQLNKPFEKDNNT